ncbi:hypothetical protein AALO_G00017400 [Alosa alosa]|uniref:Uncharacterized protein n=1 Tax=Alosa alosa TaxID=278164 RepID=A0AAV6HL76_9TELE|nr:uncharacterized protein wu:fc46h12 [Alosa alosa]KAG5286662.1 hypothetical protein AALO_G00017400 [Alosa alosa]
MQMKTWLVASVVFLGIMMVVMDPMQAQCKVIWLFGTPCREVSVTLVNQIKAWKSKDNCETGGERCLYELQFASTFFIKALHTSRLTQNVEELSFTLYPSETSSACRVVGVSVSENWSMLDDNGTNYCTLSNLIDGSGLTKVEGFKEYTNEWICLEHSTANCSIY